MKLLFMSCIADTVCAFKMQRNHNYESNVVWDGGESIDISCIVEILKCEINFSRGVGIYLW